jgi:hypothetical protein
VPRPGSTSAAKRRAIISGLRTPIATKEFTGKTRCAGHYLRDRLVVLLIAGSIAIEEFIDSGDAIGMALHRHAVAPTRSRPADWIGGELGGKQTTSFLAIAAWITLASYELTFVFVS